MEAVFLRLLNMSITGSVMILAVLPLRALLKHAPKWSICLLWALVALRLICPFTLESNLSLVPNSEPITRENLMPEDWNPSMVTTYVEYEAEALIPQPEQTPVQTIEIIPQRSEPELVLVFAYLWLTGTGIMLLYSVGSYAFLRYRLSTATQLEGNIRQSEYVTSPFVLGVFRPVIYLPYGLKQPHLNHILAHERAHICRGDHVIKPIGFLILSLHWFNPLVWLAYILLCGDIESACDERVIRIMTKEQRQAYSATLLRCSVHGCPNAAGPLAFGSTGIKRRIKGIIRYKKPVLWIVILALLAGVATGICFLTERPEPVDTTNPVAITRMEMEALLDEMLDHEDIEVVSNPRKCAEAFPETYEKLLSYDDLALSYFIPRLRKADVHSYREYLMVYVCAELTGVYSNYVYGRWWEVPQRWIAEYDRALLGDVSNVRVRPGGYDAYHVLKNDTNPYYGEYQEGPHDADFYCVTAEGLVRVYSNYVVTRWDRYHSHAYTQTVQEKVQWRWESANGVGAPQTERAQEIRKALDQSLKFLEGTAFEELLTDENCLIQPLDEGACMILSNSELYWLQSDYRVHGYRYIHYVKKLSYDASFSPGTTDFIGR